MEQQQQQQQKSDFLLPSFLRQQVWLEHISRRGLDELLWKDPHHHSLPLYFRSIPIGMLIKSALFFFVVFFFFFLKPSQIVTDFFFFFFFLRLVLSCCACAYRAPSSSSSLLGTTQQQTRQLNSTLIYDRRLPLHVIPPYRPRTQRASLLSLTI